MHNFRIRSGMCKWSIAVHAVLFLNRCYCRWTYFLQEVDTEKVTNINIRTKDYTTGDLSSFDA